MVVLLKGLSDKRPIVKRPDIKRPVVKRPEIKRPVVKRPKVNILSHFILKIFFCVEYKPYINYAFCGLQMNL